MRKRIKRSKNPEKNKWALYEQAKLFLQYRDLSPEEYEAEIDKILKQLDL